MYVGHPQRLRTVLIGFISLPARLMTETIESLILCGTFSTKLKKRSPGFHRGRLMEGTPRLTCLRLETAANHTGDTNQACSKKAQTARFRHLRQVSASRGETGSGTAAPLAENAEVESQTSDLVYVRIQNGEAQSCRELLAAAA
jgi:hypothetical protein